jgi:hypothetical protein
MFQITHYKQARGSIKICIPYALSDVKDWIDKHVFLSHSGSSKPTVVGFDTEWRPSMHNRKGENATSLVQIATRNNQQENHTLLVQLNKLPEFPNALKDLIQSKEVVKTGVGILADLRKVCDDHSFTLDDGAWTDIGEVAGRMQIDSPKKNLKSLTETLIGVEVEKSRRITMSNWASKTLSPQQIQYAAYDAVMSLDVYTALEEMKAFEVKSVNMKYEDMYPPNRQFFPEIDDSGLITKVHSREDCRRFWLKSSESTVFLNNTAKKLKLIDEALLKEISDLKPEGNHVKRRKVKKMYRAMASVILSRFGDTLQFSIRKKQVRSGYIVHLLNGKNILASGHGDNTASAAEAACYELCKEILALQQSMSDLEWFHACSGKGPIPRHLENWKNNKENYFGVKGNLGSFPPAVTSPVHCVSPSKRKYPDIAIDLNVGLKYNNDLEGDESEQRSTKKSKPCAAADIKENRVPVE